MLESYSIAQIIHTKICRKFMLINQACELKGQFNIRLSMSCIQDNGVNYPGGVNW